MRTKYCVLGAGLALVVTAAPLRAHHAFAAEFDANRPVKLKGKVTMVEWINPHAWIHLDVEKPGGKVENWQVEAGAPNALLRRGWTKTSLKVGTEIVVDGYGSKDGTHKANGRDITLPDGRKLFVGSSGTGAPDEKKK
jgi:Family of unknown function (DUF6152)